MAETRSTVEVPAWFVEPTFAGRFLAAVTDGLLLILVGIGVGVLIEDGGPPEFFVPAVAALYTIGAVALTGRTIGKRAFGLRVADFHTGATPALGPAAVRWLVPAAPGLLGLLTPQVFRLPTAVETVLSLSMLGIYWGVLVGPLHRGWHDRAADTVVTAAPMGE